MAEKTVPEVRQETAPRREETRAQERYITPPVDIYEDGTGLTVVADMPGVSRDGLDVRVAESILTLTGHAGHSTPGTPIAREYQLLNFFRQFELSDAVNVDGIRAELKHGVLTLHLPKKEKAKPRHIEVSIN
jgi:HSP20 family molecular chaperone IbpA